MPIKKLSPKTLRKHKGISFPGVTTVVICHDGKGKILMAQRSKNARDEHGRWDICAGGLKHGTSVEDNVRREAKEEFNVDLKELSFLGYNDNFRQTSDGQPTHWVAICFAALVDPRQVKMNEPDMVDDHGWFSLDALPTPIHSQFPNFIGKFGDQLRVIVGG